MIVIPAIDLRNEKAVRLTQGDYEQETVYDQNPLDLAKSYQDQGATRIHVVDLDGAKEGKATQMHVIEKLITQVPLEFEIGGGLRTPEIMEKYLSLGASRVIIGTRAALDHGFLKECLEAFGSKVIVGADARDGFIATDGWTKVTSQKALAFLDLVQKCGGCEVIYTDIATDGMMKGPNMVQLKEVLSVTPLDIIASGGISCMEDIHALRDLEAKNLLGAITGKALVEGKLDLKKAIETCRVS